MSKETYPVRWARPRECRSFWHWLFYSWNYPIGRRFHYQQVRRIGTRVLGFEFEKLITLEDE